jgi:hypothetical protein
LRSRIIWGHGIGGIIFRSQDGRAWICSALQGRNKSVQGDSVKVMIRIEEDYYAFRVFINWSNFASIAATRAGKTS